MSMPDAGLLAAARLRVTGVVQGVGFRPFVHRLAHRLGIAGRVRNVAGEVEILAEGDRDALRAFTTALRREAPPLARIDVVRVSHAVPRGVVGFRIHDSADEGPRGAPLVPPDVALCDACTRELRDPADRRHGHAFITCTDCGPRYTVIAGLPYDRARTSLAGFPQCPACEAEYHTPGDRRHHSETNGCPACGPRLAYLPAGALPDEPPSRGTPAEALDAAAALLRAGGVLALRGIGGFHLAVDATSERAVATLRARKRREAKPLALMVRTLDDARALADVSDDAARWLVRRERPIVLVPRRADARLAGGVAPGIREIGVMLAYSPLHHLLLDRVDGPLVMTSGNLSDEPIVAGVAEARERLGAIADGFLVHDREILARVDDSVLRVVEGAPVLLRRARGFAPLPVALPRPVPLPLLAVGAQMKGTFTLAAEDKAYVSPHLGDLDSLETVAHFRDALGAYQRLFGVAPLGIVRDLHPDYLSTRLARELAAELGLPEPMAVQHHHAHVAAVLAEHGVEGPVLGIAFDGTGYGDDGTIWGGELLVADRARYERVGHLRPAPLPGGDAAVRAPWRTALGYASLAAASPLREAAAAGRDAAEVRVVERQCARGLNAPLHSSIGRLFDAAAASLGVRATARYEGEAALALESLAADVAGTPLPFPATRLDDGRWQLDPVPLLVALAERRAAGGDAAVLAAAFHDAVVEATAALAARIAGERGLGTVALGGGCFQNARLLAGLRTRLEAAGLRVLVARELPPNDGAISYGQVAVAAARLRLADRPAARGRAHVSENTEIAEHLEIEDARREPPNARPTPRGGTCV